MLLKLRSTAFLTFLIVLVTQKASAQKLVRSFKGRVVDSATARPIPDVTISIFRASDTSLINFGFTTPNGNFTINVNNADSLLVVFSQLNYEDYTKKVKTMSDNWDLFNWGDIKLTNALFTLTAKVRKAAISMKEDTMEINASRFKVLPGSDVAQLFKKIPGFEVNVKGEIKVGGIAVDKIMVDGSDFFGNNPGLVSKNLQADMIETVQVYEPKNPDGSPATDQVSKTINLKLKK
ncbi:MAG: carboxypeptidase regulatory-like domain-containing protein, partial [Bacteroidetes bacterium]|nr:carboxypeptidase regulatory-like domain-containing protein [Bacteroidota bacterium]